jgi:DNA-binding response OmpR family regulator
VVTNRTESFGAFIDALYAVPGVRLDRVGSAASALDRVRTASPHLVIVDSSLPDAKPMELVRKLIEADAMMNTAVVSPLSDAAFHEAGEGLGILARVPDPPNAEDAVQLMQKLGTVLNP